MDIIANAKSYVYSKFKEELDPGFTYHNIDHTKQVVKAIEQLSARALLNSEERELLILGAWFHDLGFIIDPDNHEVCSADLADKFLTTCAFDPIRIKRVKAIIISTMSTKEPSNKLEAIMKDADLSSLAIDNYLVSRELLRKELNFRSNKTISKKNWNKKNLAFLKTHSYHTKEAKILFDKGKSYNYKSLKKMKDKNRSKSKLSTIGSSKSAQTQFKTALRNHIDLSAIADNKANIMISVNAVVLTVGMPLILQRLETNNYLIVPSIILAVGSVVSMVFATLSTRPAKMHGYSSVEQIISKKSNLFFFGNFYKMTFEEYEGGVKKVVGDNDILDNSITRDLYYLGRSVGRKFKLLRWCYDVFMYGVISAVLSYPIMLFIINN